MNILFALYNDFACNSASHVHAFANGLVSLGHNCVVAVPRNKASLSNLSDPFYDAVEFAEALDRRRLLFHDGRGPDVIHAWTPRESVRQFCTTLRERSGGRLFVHMEDNEQHLLACALGLDWDRLALLDELELERRCPPHLSHPSKSQHFMAGADGVTVIIQRLADLVPRDVPVMELWPSADAALFRPLPKSPFTRLRLGIPKNSAVIVYTGNVHEANAHEVRSLYLAVAILNREGFPTTLVRTGKDYFPFLGEDDRWGRQHAVELGYVNRSDLPGLLAQADVLVQPGLSNRFNDYRFPSKLPEFLSAGRPLILPEANIAAHMIHGRDAYILPVANAISIATAVREILNDSGLRARLETGALAFFQERLSWAQSVNKLCEFYEKRPVSKPIDRALIPATEVNFSLAQAAGR